VAAFLLLLAACQTTGSTGVSGGTDAAGATAVSGVGAGTTYSVFYDQGDHLAELVKAGKPEDAARLYGEQQAFFANDENRAKRLVDLRLIADHFNAPVRERVAAALRALESLDVPPPRTGWKDARAALRDASTLVAGYPDTRLLKDPAFRLAGIDRLADLSRTVETKLKGAAEPALQAYDLMGDEPFFSAYPVDVDPQPLLSRDFDRIAGMLDRAPKDALERFIASYPPHKVLPVALYDRASRAYEAHLKREAAVAGGPRLAQTLAVLRRMQEKGFRQVSLENEKIGFIEVTSLTLLDEGQIEFPAAIDADFPISAVKQSLDAALSDPGGPAYLIAFDVAVAKATRRVTARNGVTSSILAGVKEGPNPEYNIVQNEVSNARLEVQKASNAKA
jgi:hypothetical protein